MATDERRETRPAVVLKEFEVTSRYLMTPLELPELPAVSKWKSFISAK